MSSGVTEITALPPAPNETTYQLSDVQQLIDLNGDSSNFATGFSVDTYDPNESFYVAVVSQQLLDSDAEIPFRRFVGHAEGDVANQDGSFQNYYLALKADRPINVSVSLKQGTPPPLPRSPQWNLQRYLGIGLIMVALILLFVYSQRRGKRIRWNL